MKIDIIESLIIEDKLQDAIELVFKCSKKSCDELYKHCIILLSELFKANKGFELNIIKNEDYNTMLAKIRYAFLNLLGKYCNKCNITGINTNIDQHSKNIFNQIPAKERKNADEFFNWAKLIINDQNGRKQRS
jgi:hypothetical protein